MKKTKLACPVSNLDVLEAISDQLSIDIITTISKHPTNPDNLMQMLGITRKQYYTRTSRLLKIGVISRKHGDIILTSFGRLEGRSSLLRNMIIFTANISVQGAIENRDRILTLFRTEDDRCNKITFRDVRR